MPLNTTRTWHGGYCLDSQTVYFQLTSYIVGSVILIIISLICDAYFLLIFLKKLTASSISPSLGRPLAMPPTSLNGPNVSNPGHE